jgi:hypothetical protein
MIAKQRNPCLRHAELVSESIVLVRSRLKETELTLKQVQGDERLFQEIC